MTTRESAGPSGLAGRDPETGAGDGERCAYCGDGELSYAPLRRYGDPKTGGSAMHEPCRRAWLRDRRADAEARAAMQKIVGEPEMEVLEP